MANFKYYVVWKGFAPGVYDSWEECKAQTDGFPGAQFKSFTSKEAAVKAFRSADDLGALRLIAKHINEMTDTGELEAKQEAQPAPQAASQPPTSPRKTTVRASALNSDAVRQYPPQVNLESIAVDAACSGNPGPMEYRGVYLRTGKEIFRIGPLEGGTNNIGEFLALVHGLALLKQKGYAMPIYTDSVNAMAWVRQRRCKTLMKRTERNAQIFDLIGRAEQWLNTNSFTTPIIKWDTKAWGEIPADFGRK
jgi:ribonuclease HI